MFLNLHDTTIRNKDSDFVEWHKGMPYYGFWSVLVSDGTWLELIDAFQVALKAVTLEHYERQAHITLFTSGLFKPLPSHKQQLNRQIEQIKALKLKPFDLHYQGFASFQNCPILLIEKNIQLNNIRHSIKLSQKEDREQKYHPHITLGLYDQNLRFEQIRQIVGEHAMKSLPPLHVDRIHFCSYETHSVKGKINILETIELK